MQCYKIDDFDLNGKVVILRTDLNVPISKGKITDTTRIKRSMSTIRHLIKKNAKIVILSHFGRPKTKFNPDLSLAPIADAISEQLGGKEVKFALDILSKKAKQQISEMSSGDVLVAENIRFHEEECQNDNEFAKKIAELGNLYVNDAFSCSHRKHASIDAITNHLPSAIGLLHEEELISLKKYVLDAKDIIAITGGAKVSSKIGLLKHLVTKVDKLVVGGAMANSFLKAKGYDVGKSLCELDHLVTAAEIMKIAEQNNCELILPSDVITSKSLDADETECRSISIDNVHEDDIILDLGPQTLLDIIAKIKTSKTVIWNGPVGAFEYSPFDVGTIMLSRAIAKLTSENKIISVAGGGDVVAAINKSGLENSFSYVSTGGGAFLEWLEGKNMPGVDALMRNYERHISN